MRKQHIGKIPASPSLPEPVPAPPEDNFDIETGSAKPADLKAITDLATEYRNLVDEMNGLAEEGKRKLERARLIQDNLLPNAMTACGLMDFRLATGEQFTVKDVVSGSIPSETSIEEAEGPDKQLLDARRKKCMEWLKTVNALSLIKNKLTVTFVKGQDEAAIRAFQKLSNQGYEATLVPSVHPGTLNKFLKEKMEEGVTIPAEPFALFSGKRAQFKVPKKS